MVVSLSVRESGAPGVPNPAGTGPCFQQAAGVSAEIVGTQFALHDPATGQVHFLNESAALIWDLCDGTRTLSDITREVARLYSRPVELVASDVERVLAELRTSGLLVPPPK